VAAALTLVLTLGACGISTSGGPAAIPASQIPRVPQTTTTNPGSGCVVPVTIVLLNQLNNAAPMSVGRCVSQHQTLSATVTQLLLGPTDTELLNGIISSIPPDTRLLGLSVNSHLGQVTVNLSVEFIAGSSSQQLQEVEQVVFTIACALSASTRIIFQVEGTQQSVPIASGATVNGPVTAADDFGFGTFSCSTAP
jgi:spore germination protein GerM